jgi:hypothetical protein
MYSDLLDVLGGGGSSIGAGGRQEPERHVACMLKAGKIDLELREVRHFYLFFCIPSLQLLVSCNFGYLHFCIPTLAALSLSLLLEWQVLGNAGYTSRTSAIGVAGFAAQMGVVGSS